MIFESSPGTEDNIYSKLLSDKLPADLGYLYENVAVDAFCKKDSSRIGRPLLISQKDVANEGQLMLKPVYMLPFVLEEL